MKRNVGMHTDAQTAKLNILRHLARFAPISMTRGSAKSTLGYAAFPDYNFKTPQGAAFAVAKLAKEMEDEELISHCFVRAARGYHLTSKGHKLLAVTAEASAFAEATEGAPS